MKYEELSKSILKYVGGQENISSVTHCVTRLRLVLKDESKAQTEKIKSIDNVIAVVKSAGQYQIVIGDAVTDVYNAFIKVLKNIQVSDSSKVDKSNKNVKRKKPLISMITGIFLPLIPAMMAAGLLKGLAAIILAFKLFPVTSGTYLIIQAAGDAFFYFFPLFVGYTSAKQFGLKPFLGMLMGGALVYPQIVSMMASKPLQVILSGTIFKSKVFFDFLGIPVILMNYKQSVIPIIVATYFASKIEKLWNKVIPKLVRGALVPFLTLLVSVPFTFLFVGPIITWAADAVGWGLNAIYNLNSIISGAIIGGVWSILIIFGLHQGLAPITLNNLSVLGYDPLWANAIYTPLATAGATLGVILKTKSRKLKEIAIPAFISAVFGITEPAIYGITLPRKKVFASGIIAGACAGLVSGLFKVKMYVMGAIGIFSIPSFINPKHGIDMGFYGYLISMMVGFFVSFICSLIMYKPKEDPEYASNNTNKSYTKELETKSIKNNNKIGNNLFTFELPVKGKIEKLSEVQDDVFSKGILGSGLAVKPTDGMIYAPFDGIINVMFPTKHAVGIESTNGVKVLVHVGIDTVNLKGKYFESFVKQGDRVKKGQLLVKFDVNKIKQAGYILDTPIIVTNSNKYTKVISDYSKGRINVVA